MAMSKAHKNIRRAFQEHSIKFVKSSGRHQAQGCKEATLFNVIRECYTKNTHVSADLHYFKSLGKRLVESPSDEERGGSLKSLIAATPTTTVDEIPITDAIKYINRIYK